MTRVCATVFTPLNDPKHPWTDGHAGLPAALSAGFNGPLELVMQLGATTRYLDPGPMRWPAAPGGRTDGVDLQGDPGTLPRQTETPP